MEKIKVAIVGWGNVGRFCRHAIEYSLDMECVGVVRRPQSVGLDQEELAGYKVVSDIDELDKVDVALLCVPSREAPLKAEEFLSKGICTVDSFDIHSSVLEMRKQLNIVAEENKTVCIFASGWDPGTDSAIRALMKIICPNGITTTTFGGQKGGRSMGHTAAVKAIDGVKNAVSLTLPNGAGKHKRQVYIELKEGADFQKVADAIRQDAYFASDPTDVVAVDNVSVYDTLNHGGEICRIMEDISQRYTLEGNNPKMTANVLISCVRAAYRAKGKKQFGAYTFIERPLIDYLPGDEEEQMSGY